MTPNKNIIRTASLLGAIAVILGAMGAHALKGSIEASSLESYITAVRYQMWHSLALLFLAILGDQIGPSKWVYRLWTLGIIFFSGSIYALSLDELIHQNFSFLGPITPLGGLLLIAGWIVLFINTLRK